MKKNEITVALAGNPNSGKTTIFNNLTGARQHVGNYPGVTIEKKFGDIKYRGYRINVVDLPGTYSLTAYSVDELVARNFIIDDKPDIVVNIVDASNLERNLYLTTQLLELKIPLVLVFNMWDEVKKYNKNINKSLLSKLLGAPVVETVGSKNIGTAEILEKIIEVYSQKEKSKIEIKYGAEIENELLKIKNILTQKSAVKGEAGSDWIALKLMEQDNEVLNKIKAWSKDSFDEIKGQVQKSIDHIEKIMDESPSTLIADARYGFISGALAETYSETDEDRITVSEKIDKVLTNRIFGLPIFALIMWAMFQLVFRAGAYPMEWIETGFIRLGEFLAGIIPEGLIQSLIVDGIIGGVGGVIVFTPNIILLFLCIAILEGTGYMARVAFIMDKLMHKIGLHGKSFIPMIIGFGCTIPAYMGSRILESKKDRLVTMHVNTYMSCGARLPVYILFAGAFFKLNSGNVVFSIYIIGIAMALLVAKLLRLTRFRGESDPFVMELPPYRIPTLKSVLIHTWERTWLYLKKAGTIILAVSVLMWILFTFPAADISEYENRVQNLEEEYFEGSISVDEYNEELFEIDVMASAMQLEYSAAGRIGKFIEPVFKPLGFDWKLAVASISGIAAKEVVVSTLGTIYSIEEADEESVSLREKLSEDYIPLTGYNFMLFTLLYFPCMAGMVVFKREAGIKETLFQIVFTLIMAWSVSAIVFQIGKNFI